MKKIRLILSLFIALVSAGGAKQSLAQTPAIDSLKTLLAKEKIDTTRVNLMNGISWNYINLGEYISAMKHAEKAKALAQKIKFKNGLAGSLLNIGVIHDYQGNMPEALENYSASLKIYKQTGNKTGIARCFNNIGIIFTDQGDYLNALAFYDSSMKIKIELDDRKGIGSIYNQIGTVFLYQGNYPEALKNFYAYRKEMDRIHNKKGTAGAYNNIAIVYERQNNYTEALINHLAALKLNQEIGHKSNVAASYNNIGVCYLNTEKYTQALENFKTALNFYEELEEKSGIAATLGNIGLIYDINGDYEIALTYLLSGLNILEELKFNRLIPTYYNNIGMVNIRKKNFLEGRKWLNLAMKKAKLNGGPEDLKFTHSGLAQVDSALGNYKAALEHFKLYVIYRDSIINEENTKQLIQQQMQYDFDKKEALSKAEQDKKDALALEELEHQKMQRNGFIAGFSLMMLLAGVSYRNYRNKQKANMLLAHKNEVIEEKQKEILDSINYAKRIQAAILPPERIVKQYLPNSFILYKPKDIVAGDFYWMHLSLNPSPQGEGKAVLNPVGIAEQSPLSLRRGAGGEVIFFAAADCTGHGVPGAMVSVICNNGLNRSVREYGITDPGNILDKTREIVIQEFEKSDEDVKDGMDISLCSLQGNTLHWSGANNPLWIIRPCHSERREESIDASLPLSMTDYELLELKPNKQPIGKYAEPKPFTAHTIELAKGDTIYLFTDGFADQFGGPKGKKFKYAQLKELLLSIQAKTMDEQSQILNHKFEQWKGNLEQVDDVCIIGVRV
jgi:tetratricopeptide (TPR) repeat protein